MNDVQENCEPKNIYLTKSIENTDVITDPTTSALQYKPLKTWSGEQQVRIPPRRHMPPVDKYGDEHMSNHKKQRYWNSWEELYLVELWRRYRDEVTLINVPLPVYRKMMIAMRNRNMIVTAQDCRRKINTINTRYKQELLRMKSSGHKSEWRLFPLVQCVLQPQIKDFDPWHEIAVIKKLLDKIPKPVEAPTAVINNIQNNNHYHPPQIQNLVVPHSNISSYKPRNSYQTSLISANLPLAVPTDISTIFKRPSPHDNFEKMSILPFRNVTVEKIEELRKSNTSLAQKRDEDLNRLHIEEQHFKCFEEFIHRWTEQKELELQRIQLISAQGVVNIGNEKNSKAEQLEENIVPK